MKKDKTANKKMIKTVKELIPIAYYDTGLKAYKRTDGSYLDMFKIKTKDLYNASDDALEFDIYRLGKFFKTTGDDIKLIALNFPCDTSKQIEYIEKKIKTCKNEIYFKFLTQKKETLIWLNENSKSREYVFMIFAKNEQELDKIRTRIKSCLGTGVDGLMEIMEDGLKHRVLRKICNKNSAIF